MLRKHMMALYAPDVKEASGAAPSAAPETGGEQTPPDDQQPQVAAEAETVQDVKEPTTLEEAALAAYKASSAEPADAQGQQLTQTAEEGKVEEKPSNEEQKGPIPYDRFHEVLTEKQRFEGKIKELEPLAETQKGIVNWCQQKGISKEDFNSALELAALVKENPMEALKRLGPVVDGLKALSGEGALPQDLATAVEAGEISEAWAKKIAQQRAQEVYSQANGKAMAARQAQDNQSRVVAALDNWDMSKRKTDLDFSPRKNENEPLGKFELVQDRLARLWAEKPPQTPVEVAMLAEKAYADVSATFAKKLTPPKPPIKALSSSRSSVTAKKKPESIEDVAAEVGAKYGLSLVRSEED